MESYVTMQYPIRPASAVQSMASDPNIVVEKVLYNLGMVIIQTDPEYAEKMRHTGYSIESLEGYEVIFPQVIRAAEVPYTGREIVQLLGADRFHDRGVKGQGIRIAVLDQGIRITHKGFKGKTIEQYDFTGEGSDIFDFHGTPVASLIVGEFPEVDFIGVAPEATIGDFKVYRKEHPTNISIMESALLALDAAPDLGYRILSCSFLVKYHLEVLPWYTNPMAVAVSRLAAMGVLVIAAAGNDGPAPGSINYYPAAAPDALTVGGYDVFTRGVWGASSRGETPDGFMKPDIIAPAWAYEALSADSDDSLFLPMGGTSGATPLVAGIAALVFQSIGRIDRKYFLDTLPLRAVRV